MNIEDTLGHIMDALQASRPLEVRLVSVGNRRKGTKEKESGPGDSSLQDNCDTVISFPGKSMAEARKFGEKIG